MIAKPKSKNLAKYVQRGDGSLRRPRHHPGAHCGVEHPRRQLARQAVSDLDVHDLVTAPTRTSIQRNLLAVQRVPWILDHNKL